MFIDIRAARKTLRKLGVNFITLGVIGFMLQNIKDFDMHKIHALSIALLVVGVIIWIVALVEFDSISRGK